MKMKSMNEVIKLLKLCNLREPSIHVSALRYDRISAMPSRKKTKGNAAGAHGAAAHNRVRKDCRNGSGEAPRRARMTSLTTILCMDCLGEGCEACDGVGFFELTPEAYAEIAWYEATFERPPIPAGSRQWWVNFFRGGWV